VRKSSVPVEKVVPIFDPEQLPVGWKMPTIGDICVKVHKVNPKDEPDAEFNYIDISGIDNEHFRIANTKRYFGTDAPSRARQFVHRGDVVFSTVRTYLKNFARVTPELDGQIASTGFCVLRAASEELSKYLFYFVQYEKFLNELAKFQRGTSYPAVRDSDVFAQYIPVPPKGHAGLIVAEIEKQFSRLDEAVANLKRVKANLKRYKAAILKAAVEGKLTEEWRKQHPDIEPADKLLERILAERREKWQGRGKYKEPAAPDTTDLPELPEGWVWVTLPQLGELNRGKSKHRPRNDPKLYGGPYPFVQTGDVRHAVSKIKEYTQTYSDEGLAQSRLWPEETLCITIAANIADTALLGFEACFPDSIVGFLPETNHTDVRFIEYFIRTAKENLERFAPATAQKNINLEILKAVAVPCPPENEQKIIAAEIEARLSVVECIESSVDASLRRNDRLRQSILKKAFSGALLEPSSI